ncbi:glycerophosphodiester phosphodiesterase [Vallicoccus soli]|uniref:glycerophosphodiester phosphodiesterase n=1 Tax=Vallicoccus soli TaxID=2339232 RepID=A0A3A3YSG5_9ACTN|nr:glycerophosphodiester phosphodiesterase [Vallicoccus soli]RJK92637.1 glycerophosphodiester phosphodiesterase [Vallicoccus soli]
MPLPTRRGLLARAAAPVVLLALVAVPGAPATAEERPAQRSAAQVSEPLVFGHRGASGYRPEHTLASYQLAIRLGADVIEPDLVSTKDGVLVARHENEISGTTDVADRPEFADRRATKTIDGVELTGWFTEDFTLRELKTLRAKERIPEIRQENTIYDGRYQVPTLQEVIDLAKRASRETGRRIAIAPETKHPTYFDSIGLSLEEPLVRALRRNGWAGPKAPVWVQSFEVSNLKELDRRVGVRLVQLLSGSGAPYDVVAAGGSTTYADLVTRQGLRGIARYADVIGPDKNLIVPRDADAELLPPTTLVRDAHRAGLQVVPYTFRNENAFLPADFRRGDDPSAYGDAFAEYRLFLALGVDGLFSDNPDTAVEARDAWVEGRPARAAAQAAAAG